MIKKEYCMPCIKTHILMGAESILAASGHSGVNVSVGDYDDGGEEDLDGGTFDSSGGSTSTPMYP